jgi:phosphoglycolate phosphatase
VTVLVFDLDGTLVDSVADIAAAVNALLQGEGVVPLSDAAVRGYVGNGVPVLVGRVMQATGLGADPARHAALTARFLAIYQARATGHSQPYPGVEKALAALAAHHPLAICTNKPLAPARAVLAALGLERFFPVVIAGDSLPVTKPDPALLHAAIAAHGGGAALFVGDSEVDAETARAAEVPFLLFTEGYRKSPVTAIAHAGRFSAFDDLPDLIKRVAGQLALDRRHH